MELDERGDGRYIFKTKLARYASERYLTIDQQDPAERTDDEHLIHYLMEELAFYNESMSRIFKRDEEKVAPDTFFQEQYEELVLCHEGVMDALRANGYTGTDRAVEVSRWLMGVR